MTHRVAITGIGMLTPLGIGREASWEGLLAGDVATDTISRFDVSAYASRVAAQIDDFDPTVSISPKRVRWTDRFSQFAIAASREAIEDAHFERDGEDVGVFVGSALGGLAYADEQHDVFRERGLDAVRPLLAISVFGGAATSNVALEFGFTGINAANANSCASGAMAIGEAFRAVARGDVRCAVAGGVEAPLSPLIFGAFTIIHSMSTRNDDPTSASRPFDRDRDGFVMGEGAAMLVVERLDDAVARGAHVYAEIVGYGVGNDAHHMSAPRPDGAVAARVITSALREAAIAPSDVDAISAHGSSTVLGDRGEATALRAAFGEAIPRVAVMATKGQHGHALGATGAWEIALGALSIARGWLPRVVNLGVAADDCNLNFARETRRASLRTVLSNTAGFGGINAALVLRGV